MDGSGAGGVCGACGDGCVIGGVADVEYVACFNVLGMWRANAGEFRI
jgi:hypothetical protein